MAERQQPPPYAGSERYAWYALGVMLFTYVVAFIDRQAINLLVDPIKAELSLSDTQVSLLQGFAFALVLSLAGLPMGRWIDIGRRTTILASGAVVWSLMTLGCGCARSFPALLAFRAGVGAGESVMTPSALSLIGDYFPRKRLGLAISVYALGLHVGTGLALLLGAFLLSQVAATVITLPGIGAITGWRLVFFCLAPLGFIAALWVASLREPVRGGSRDDSPKPSWSEVLAYMRISGRAQLGVNVAVGFALMTTYGVHAWAPSFFIRHFGWSATQAGQGLGIMTIVTGISGVLTAGIAGDLIRARGTIDARLWIMGVCVLCAMPLIASAPHMTDAAFSIVIFGAANFFTAAAVACGPAILQELSPARVRGVTHAVAVLCVNLLASGLGPLAIALFTDKVLQNPQGVGISLSRVPPVLLLMSCLAALTTLSAFRSAVASTLCNERGSS